MKRLIGLALLFLLIFAISQNPSQWATTTQNIGGGIADGARGVGDFLARLSA